MSTKNEKAKAAVLFSGGIDSTTALYWAKNTFSQVFALIFHYGQHHCIEVDMAERIARRLYTPFDIIRFPLNDIVYSALTDKKKDIPTSLASSRDAEGIPFTYVPFRNGIFLSIAAAFAESRGITELVTGFNLIDTPDYPDTTGAFAQKMEAAINEGTSASITGRRFAVHTPLILKSKKEIIEMGLELGVDYSFSISCYRGNEVPCLACPSCDIRSRAFSLLHMEDPLITRLKKEGRL